MAQPRSEPGTVHCPKPSCGAPMVRRTNRQNGSEFMGCSEYPACTETMPIPESIRLREAGALELPGFD
jgi:ssDNA-binding Zn-finger/Zn-ribbon topoisomerase 1